MVRIVSSRITRPFPRRISKLRFVAFVCLVSLVWIIYSALLVLWSSAVSTAPKTNPPPVVNQYVRYNKRGKQVMHRIDRVRLDDLRDLTDDRFVVAAMAVLKNQSTTTTNRDIQHARQGKEVLLNELYQSGIRDMDEATIQLLPSWNEVAQLYYRHVDPQDGYQPIIFGLDKCRAFAQRTAKQNQSFLATAGLYNTGTNALTYYLRANLRIKGNPLFDGILVQVPWHKHWFVNQRLSHSIPYLSNITLSNVLPIVTIRDPLTWAQSMCDQPYDVEWIATGKASAPPQCPSLTRGDPSIRLPKQTGPKTYDNLWSLYNDWYNAYLQDTSGLDFVMIRHEDLLYCPRKVISAIQACSGAQWVASSSSDFVYVMDQAKWEHARLSGKAQSNRVSAMIKHGHANFRRIRHLKPEDMERAKVNQSLLDLFGYNLPPNLPK